MSIELDTRQILRVAARAQCSERTVRRYLADPFSVNDANRMSIDQALSWERVDISRPKVAKLSSAKLERIVKLAGCCERTVRRYMDDPNSVTMGNRGRIERALRGRSS